MISKHEHQPVFYNAEVLDQPFVTSNHKLADKTVRVSTLDTHLQVVRQTDYALRDTQDIYDTIQAGKPLNLDFCFVKDLSVSDYREHHNLSSTETVTIKDFSANQAFFQATNATDFSGVVFTGNLAVINCIFGKGHANFRKSVFQGESVDFSGTAFGKGDVDFHFAEFTQGTVSFENISVGGGNVSFVNSAFYDGRVSFRNAHFGSGEADFHFSRFRKGDVLFDRCVFRGPRTNFSKIEFGEGKVDFKRTDFGHGEVNFSESEFGPGKINFSSTQFGDGPVLFEMTDFGENEAHFDRAGFGKGKLSFLKAKMQSLTLRSCLFNNYVDLRVDRASTIDLSDTVVRDMIDLKPGEGAVEIDLLYLAGMRNLGRIYIDFRGNDVPRLIASQPDTTLEQKAEQFRLLKEDFHRSGQYNDEDAAYVQFKRFELRAFRKEKLSKNILNALWVDISVGFQRLVFDKIGLYATDPVRVLLSSVFIYIGFSLLYVGLIKFTDSDIVGAVGEPLTVVGKSFYHSAITFLTIGYGDHYPVGHVRWVSSIEGWIGLFLMSYFTVAFVRKILR